MSWYQVLFISNDFMMKHNKMLTKLHQGRPGLPGARGATGRKGISGSPGEQGVSITGGRGDVGLPAAGRVKIGTPGFRVSGSSFF